MEIDKRMIFYQGKHVLLKVLQENDIANSGWVGWFNDEKITSNTQHHYYPNTFENQRNFLKSLESKSKIQLGIVSRNNLSEICGVISLSNINSINGTAEIGHILDSKLTKSNPGVIIESWMLMIKHGFNELRLNKICAGTTNKNVEIVLKKSFNFFEEGVLHEHIFKNGKYHDVKMLAVFKSSINYPKL